MARRPTRDRRRQQRDLATFLLLFFIPQVLLYAFGAIATGLLYARRRFAITAAAPIGNRVVMIVCLVAFRVVAGPEPGLRPLDRREAAARGRRHRWRASRSSASSSSRRGAPASRCGRAGAGDDEALAPRCRASRCGACCCTRTRACCSVPRSSSATASRAVSSRTRSRSCSSSRRTPILAQPIHTAILPELATEAARGDLDAFARSVEWALDRMAVLGRAGRRPRWSRFALPMMRLVAFGGAAKTGPSCSRPASRRSRSGSSRTARFLLLARAFYALGDSRTPAIVAIASALLGVATMIVLAPFTHGAARVAALGIGHTTAYAVGAIVLGVDAAPPARAALRAAAAARRDLLRDAARARALGSRCALIDPDGRLATIGVLAVVGRRSAAARLRVARCGGGIAGAPA